MKPWNWWSKVQARDVYAAPKRITALEALDGKKQLEVYAARVYAAEDEGGYIWLNLSMLSQDKATRVVRVPVGLLVDAHGQQNGDRRTDLAMPRRSASQRPLSGDLASSRPVGSPRQLTCRRWVHMHSLRQRPARIVAALCGLIALLVLGVSSAAVDAPALQPRIIPLSGSMTLGGTSTVTTALLSPEVASASL